MIKIAFAGNPNTGKSALINALAGSNLKVGNWPGVTVEKKEAYFNYENNEIMLVDLPGVYSLSPYTLEEKITRDFILNENPDIVINVVDSTNLERNLYLSCLLKELKKPMIMALNFYDEFDKLDYKLDFSKFIDLIEYPAIPTSALKRKGLKELMDKVLEVYSKKQNFIDYQLPFQKDIQNELEEIKKILLTNEKYKIILNKYHIDYVAVKLLERDSWFNETVLKESGIDFKNFEEERIEKLEKKYENDIETILAEQRY
ncbi:FeoB small GTPase domain-containing protein, partial [Fusobacterium sp.]